MQLKQVLELNETFRYFIHRLELYAPATRRYLHELHFQTDASALEREFQQVEKMQHLLNDDSKKRIFSELKHKLAQIFDINSTIKCLHEGHVLNDIELFELKKIAVAASEISSLMVDLDIVNLTDVRSVFTLLDPDKTQTSTFYIYDSYSQQLSELRTKIKKLDANARGVLFEQIVAEEDRIRAILSAKLRVYAPQIESVIRQLTYLDLLVAKSQLTIELKCCRPQIVTDVTSYRSLFNPKVGDELSKKSKIFQAIDIDLVQCPTLITGMNMGGKTVLLKTLAAVQYLFQFGFYVPAAKANIVIVDAVAVSFEDQQIAVNGLSSFAVEMKQINQILKLIRSDKKILALIDEPARTTNPTEGRAIVEALLEILSNNKVCSLVSSHYDNIHFPCVRLRVRGFKGVTEIEDINSLEHYIDYSLEPDQSPNVPHEALRIATMLQIDKELLKIASENISKR